MYSLDTNIQTALDRKAALVRAVQAGDSAKTNPTAYVAPRAGWLVGLLAAIGLGWLVR
jgi:hypothetical protein